MKSLKIAGALGILTLMAGCVPDWARENETGIIMEIASIQPAEAGGTLRSDVLPDINDDAIVTVNVYRKNPSVTETSPLEHVRLESYSVRYFRTDGHSVEGLDVPHRITGALGAIRFHTPTSTGEIQLDAVITLVRQQAKHESPLAQLVGVVPSITGSLIVPGQGIITTIAEVTVYARQVTTGEPLSATGTVEVQFADFADEQ
jgi:hypothetical protein